MTEMQRYKHNKAILEKMARGESLATVSVQSTWFPPRPLTRKEPSHLKLAPRTPPRKVLTFKGKK